MTSVRFNEVRTLIVPIEAAIDAVLELDRHHGGRLARSKVMEAIIESGASPSLLLIIRHATASAPTIEQRRYSLPAVAAAVIHYCGRLEVPLPRKAAKCIEIVPEGFELKLTSVTEVKLLNQEVPRIPVQIHLDKASVRPIGDRSTAKSPVDTTTTVVSESALSEASAATG